MPFPALSPGVGLRPPPPPLVCLQGHRGQRVETTGVLKKGVRFTAYRKPSAVAGGGSLGKIKEEAVAAGGGRGTFAEGPTGRYGAITLAAGRTGDITKKNPRRNFISSGMSISVPLRRRTQ